MDRDTLIAIQNAYTALGDLLGRVLVDVTGELAYSESYLTAKLGPLGEWNPGWLGKLNDGYRAKWPTGLVGEPGPGFGADPSIMTRTPLILIGSIVTPLIGQRGDLDQAQRDAVQTHCHGTAYGLGRIGIRDAVTDLMRITPVWIGTQPIEAGEYTVALGPWYDNERQIHQAVIEYYKRAFGPL